MKPSHNEYEELKLRMAACRGFAQSRLPHHSKIAAGIRNMRRHTRRNTARPPGVAGSFKRHCKHVR
jgi:hypothetical protein